MIKVLKYSGNISLKKLSNFLDSRKINNYKNIKLIMKIINDVKKNKLKAVIKYEKKFSKNSRVKPTKKEINDSIKLLSPKVKRAIDFAYKRIFRFHLKQAQIKNNFSYKDIYNNKVIYKTAPIESVAVYVPGNLPSTLLMNSIPAKIAKVKRIVLATPKIEGKLNPAVMYAAKKVGINEIYSMGGSQAIASLVFLQKVKKIIGPGNKFVAEAKKILSGKLIGTESMYAGPSEICVIADKKTDINQIVTSLISQSEHDRDSQSILVTKDEIIIKKIMKEVKKQLLKLPRKKIAKQSLKKNGLIIRAKNNKQITDIVNEIAPEHLEINVNNYSYFEKKIFNAGSICNGKYTPMSISDYTVGTNHVLPTYGSAKFSSGLNIGEFLKKYSVITLTKIGVEKIGNPAITLSEFEQLKGHAQSIKSRIRSK